MDLSIPDLERTELAAAYLQLTVTLGLAVLCVVLSGRYRKPYFGLWALTWLLYALRLGAIITFLHTGVSWWLFWHQVLAGWTALALLWAALVFAQRVTWRSAYVLFLAIPLVWSFVAIYLLDQFLWAAGPMVGFLSITTAGTAWAFFRYDRLVGVPRRSIPRRSIGALGAASSRLPLPARPRGLESLGVLPGHPVRRGHGLGHRLSHPRGSRSGPAHADRLVRRIAGARKRGGSDCRGDAEAGALVARGAWICAVPRVRGGGALLCTGRGSPRFGPSRALPAAARESAALVQRSGLPAVRRDDGAQDSAAWTHAYTAALPVIGAEAVVGALVVVGEARDPFTVLDNRFLVAFGQQVGAALENEGLHRNLETRTEELERLQALMVHQHEEERNRLWRELHDETAQVLARLDMHLGLLQERSDPELAQGLVTAKTLVGEGIKSIRSVTRNLRPTALDDLGLVPALRALARDFQAEDIMEVNFESPASWPADWTAVGAEVELVLFRALQEALSNAVRHGDCTRVDVALSVEGDSALLTVLDNGGGLPEDALQNLRSRGGLAGVRERVAGVRGDFEVGNGPSGGARVLIRVPLLEEEDGK